MHIIMHEHATVIDIPTYQNHPEMVAIYNPDGKKIPSKQRDWLTATQSISQEKLTKFANGLIIIRGSEPEILKLGHQIKSVY